MSNPMMSSGFGVSDRIQLDTHFSNTWERQPS
jgi:hypothetical protein